jgi:hypothetical protein
MMLAGNRLTTCEPGLHERRQVQGLTLPGMLKSEIAMAKSNYLVWLSREAGHSFMGLVDTQQNLNTRFCISGHMVGEWPGVGFWLDVEWVKERTIPDNRLLNKWVVKPRKCLILWGYVTHIQEGDDKGTIGFKAVKGDE